MQEKTIIVGVLYWFAFTIGDLHQTRCVVGPHKYM